MSKLKRIGLAALAWIVCHFSIYIGAAFLGVEQVPGGAVAIINVTVAVFVYWMTGARSLEP